MKIAHSCSPRRAEEWAREAVPDLGLSFGETLAGTSGNEIDRRSRQSFSRQAILDDAMGQDGVVSLARWHKNHPVPAERGCEVPARSLRQIEEGAMVINDLSGSLQDPGAMNAIDDRLDPARGVLLGLGLGACMWAIIGTLVLWLA